MLTRTIIHKLKKWAKSPGRKPLLLRGARQVGKTVAVNLFSSSFEQYISLNLERKKDREIFEAGLSAHDLYQAILLSGKYHHDKNTLLFIDEIQQCPAAVASLRYFLEDLPDLAVIAAGSLLEVMLQRNEISFPVGRVEQLYMDPLTFEEFLLASGEDSLIDAFNTVPLPQFAFPKLLDTFHRYAMIGGMPEIVDYYFKDKAVSNLNNLYQSLLQSYLDDIGKYAVGGVQAQILRHCIETSPFEAGKRINFAGFGNSNYKSREIGECLRMLERAMLIKLIYPTVSTAVPIVPDFKKHPKLQFLDTGLCNFFVGLQQYYLTADDLHSFYKGRMAEHVVLQEIIAHSENILQKTCFWTRESKNSSAEIDCVLQYKSSLIPVEVKSGKSGKLHSVHLFIDAAKDSKVAVRLSSACYSEESIKTPKGNPFTLLNIPYVHASKINSYLDQMESAI
ncbi:MAG: AAA family ATPase [Chitinivibrionales bacterium]|nr:AAA family ATPase [Chitinivibrionales bacterium]